MIIWKDENMKKHRNMKKKLKKTLIMIVVALVLFVIFSFVFYYQKVDNYNTAVNDFNIMADEYNKIAKEVSTENINNLPKTINNKEFIWNNPIGYIMLLKDCKLPNSVEKDCDELRRGLQEYLADYVVVEQIKNPETDWVKSRLEMVELIESIGAVTSENNPDGLLGKEGGYKSCIYFGISGVDSSQIDGETIVDKGTDAGGAIEIYETLEDAQKRVDYLRDFDNTMLYSGSYAIVGTMVVRISYILTGEQQLEMTDKIVKAFTAIEE